MRKGMEGVLGSWGRAWALGFSCPHPTPLLTGAPSLPCCLVLLWSPKLWNDEVDKVSRLGRLGGRGLKWVGMG